MQPQKKLQTYVVQAVEAKIKKTRTMLQIEVVSVSFQLSFNPTKRLFL